MGTNNDSNLDTYDVIIIGAGIGGLTAGNILVKKGYKVLILEKHNIPGGYCTNFKRKDFVFDTSIHMINGCEEGGMIYNILKKFDAEDIVEFIKLDELFHWADPSKNIDLHLSSDLNKYIEDLVALFPEHETEIRKFYKRYSNVFRFMTKFISGGLLSRVSTFFRYFRSFIRFLSLFRKSASDVVDSYFTNQDLKRIVTGLSGYFGLPLEELSAIIYFAGTFAYHIEGAYYPKGGSGNLSKTLTNIFKNNGGTILFLSEVKKINFENNLANEVVVEDKRGDTQVYLTRSIIANSDVTSLVTKLIPDGNLPLKYINKVKERKPSVSAVCLYLGLDIDLKDYGHTDYEYWTPWGGDFSIEHQKYILKTADYSSLPSGAVSIYSNIDPQLCPPGKSILTALYYAIPEPFEKELDENGNRGEDYKALKGKIADEFINQLKVILAIPDLDSHIEVIELATPLTFKRYTHNRDGAFIGWEMTNSQMILKNLFQKTPISNLFLGGQWSLPGGGVSAAMSSGDFASKKAYKYLKKNKKKSNI
jgi:prolycopene isomerase